MLMKQRVEEMEREAKKLRELQAAAEQASNDDDDGGVPMETEEDKSAADNRSVYVGNVSGTCWSILDHLFIFVFSSS
jgi:polyadenylate-binding protein 2